MKLIRYGAAGKEKPGVQIEERYYGFRSFGEDYNELFFQTNGLERLHSYIADFPDEVFILPEGTRLGSPIARPSKIVCVGLNYADHAKESGAAIPKEPILFFKSTTAMVGPNDEVMIPRDSKKTDWEVELAVVIGRKARYVEEGEAMDYVLGYMLHNDVSEREYQLERGGTWDKGKGCDTFAPLGPVLVTKEEIADIHHVDLWLKLNGELLQKSNTNQLIFNIPQLVSYISQFMTLLPGDVISTGTPAGVGLGFDPPVYLKPGDVMELGATGLGVARQKVVDFKK